MNSRMNNTEEQISDLEDRIMESTQSDLYAENHKTLMKEIKDDKIGRASCRERV